MLFSVTFGPDLAGKVTMNFGALNGTGGEKRLNVAITRARRELHVFSAIRAEQINLARTHAVGVRDLKAFLDYAERGSIALPAHDEGSLGPAESPFAEAVSEALRLQGWEVRTPLGVSGFRIDLGVVHPDAAGSYLAGVECDGAQYHASATARDRDKVRQAVLEGLGWTILRVWSTDWFRDTAGVTERVHTELAGLLERDREARKAREAETENQEEPIPEETVEEPEETSVIEQHVVPAKRICVPHDHATAGSNPQPERAPLIADSAASPESALIGASENARRDGESSRSIESTTETDLAAVRSTPSASEATRPVPDDIVCDPDRFFNVGYTPILRRIILTIVESEGPIRLDGLARKVAQQHGWQRTGRRIQERVRKNLRSVESHSEFGTAFVWAPGTHTSRVPFRGLAGRSIRDISRTEIASVIDARRRDLVIAEDPVLTLSRYLGIARLSKDARAYLADCVRWREETVGVDT